MRLKWSGDGRKIFFVYWCKQVWEKYIKQGKNENKVPALALTNSYYHSFLEMRDKSWVVMDQKWFFSKTVQASFKKNK